MSSFCVGRFGKMKAVCFRNVVKMRILFFKNRHMKEASGISARPRLWMQPTFWMSRAAGFWHAWSVDGLVYGRAKICAPPRNSRLRPLGLLLDTAWQGVAHTSWTQARIFAPPRRTVLELPDLPDCFSWLFPLWSEGTAVWRTRGVGQRRTCLGFPPCEDDTGVKWQFI